MRAEAAPLTGCSGRFAITSANGGMPIRACGDHLLLSSEMARRLVDGGAGRWVRGEEMPAITLQLGSCWISDVVLTPSSISQGGMPFTVNPV
jgi:hypothetical protein